MLIEFYPQPPHTVAAAYSGPINAIARCEETSGRGVVGMYLGLLVPGVLTTPTGAFSSPAAMAQSIRSQNASSCRTDWGRGPSAAISSSLFISNRKLSTMKGGKEEISRPTRGTAQSPTHPAPHTCSLLEASPRVANELRIIAECYASAKAKSAPCPKPISKTSPAPSVPSVCFISRSYQSVQSSNAPASARQLHHSLHHVMAKYLILIRNRCDPSSERHRIGGTDFAKLFCPISHLVN